MTVIIAITHNEKVWMGGDRNRNMGPTSFSSPNPKVWKRTDDFENGWVFGSAGNSQLHQIAQYQVSLPIENPYNQEDLCGYLYRGFVLPLYKELKECGALIKTPKGKDDMEGTILLGLCGKIFHVNGLAVNQISNAFATTGIADDAAFCHLDALFTHGVGLTPEQMIRSAIHSAGTRFPVIGGGMDIICT